MSCCPLAVDTETVTADLSTASAPPRDAHLWSESSSGPVSCPLLLLAFRSPPPQLKHATGVCKSGAPAATAGFRPPDSARVSRSVWSGPHGAHQDHGPQARGWRPASQGHQEGGAFARAGAGFQEASRRRLSRKEGGQAGTQKQAHTRGCAQVPPAPGRGGAAGNPQVPAEGRRRHPAPHPQGALLAHISRAAGKLPGRLPVERAGRAGAAGGGGGIHSGAAGGCAAVRHPRQACYRVCKGHPAGAAPAGGPLGLHQQWPLN